MATYKKYKKDSPNSYALGITLNFELLKMRPDLAYKIYIHSQMTKNETYDKLIGLCELNGIEVIYTDKIFNVISKKENCYVIGEFKKEEGTLSPNRNHIVLVNPSNAGNIGTIMRSALGFGFYDIAIIRPAVDIFDPKSVRASMGACFSLNVKYFDSFSEYADMFIENNNRKSYPFMLQAKSYLHEISHQKDERCSLIFGNEATGLDESFLKIGTPLLIPITDKVDSLNLPIAASIAMHKIYSESL